MHLQASRRIGQEPAERLALYRLGGLWRSCRAGQQHWAGVGEGARYYCQKLGRFDLLLYQQECWWDARLAAAVGGGVVSLIDPSLPAPFVPVSVFTGVQLDVYWSATTSADFPADAWYMDFSNSNGGVHGNLKPDLSLAWCVRGPMNADAY